LLRRISVHFADQADWKSQVSNPNATSPESDRLVGTACQNILIPHQH
jgi:hypothetical protein